MSPGGATPVGDPRFFDSHCHVYDARVPDGPDAAVQAAVAAGVTTMVAVGCDRSTTLAALDVASRHPDHVHPTAGLHPHDASHGVETIADLVTRPEIVGVGETGLDYYYDHSPRDVQRLAFAAQIQLSRVHGLPLVVHTRDAWADTLDVLRAEGPPADTIFHCFTGGSDEARACLDMGAWLSFSGIVTFKNATAVQDAARLCPWDRMLIETDSPYLAPHPHRGQINRPAWVTHVAEFIGAMRDLPVRDVAWRTDANGRAAFRLGRGSRPHRAEPAGTV